MEEAMYLPNKTYQDHDLKVGVTSELRVRLAPLNRFKHSSKIFY